MDHANADAAAAAAADALDVFVAHLHRLVVLPPGAYVGMLHAEAAHLRQCEVGEVGKVTWVHSGNIGSSGLPWETTSCCLERALSARRIDLHTHSSASDGTTPPAQLVREARDAGLDVVALTDHDTTAGWDEAAAALPSGLSLVRGTELSCSRGGISMHLLAYLFDPVEPEFAAVRLLLRDSRVSRAEHMVQMLADDGHPITWEQVRGLAGGTVGRPHIAQALMAHGLVGSVSEAFDPEWIGTRGRYWVAKAELDVVDGVRLVTGAGGVAVFAHPAASRRGRTVGDDVIALMAGAGLVGLEVDHIDQDDSERAHLRGLAAELGLLTTGSSDFHGDNKEVRLGAFLTDESTYDDLISRATGLEVLAA